MKERARKAVPNQGLTWVADIASQQHPFAIDYIEQAPVLVIGATFGASSKKVSHAERQFVASRFKRIEGKKLKAAMKEFHLPYPLRKLRSTAIAPSYTAVIWRLRRVNPSTLSQSIPDKVNHQRWWLTAIRTACRRAENRSRPLSDEAFEWLVKRLRVEPGVRARDMAARAADVTDMFVSGRFNPVWTFDEAIAAHAQWVADVAKRVSLADFVKQYGVDLEHEVDYSPQPNEPTTHDVYEFVPLRSGEALFVEGTIMRHCVPSYMRDILSGGSCIYSMRREGKRIATLELSSGDRPVIKQLKGPCNAHPTINTSLAAEVFVAAIHANRKTAMDKLKGMLSGMF
jgi:hypothetical protein